MIGLYEVSEFVDDYIIDYEHWGFDETPVEIDVAVYLCRSPTDNDYQRSTYTTRCFGDFYSVVLSEVRRFARLADDREASFREPARVNDFETGGHGI